MKRKVTIRDVARACNVSAPTVSRVLNKRYENFSVTPVKRELIEKTARELGYVPNPLARSLSSRHSRFIGLSFPWSFTWIDSQGGDMPDWPDTNFVPRNFLLGFLHACKDYNYTALMLPRDEVSEEPLPRHEVFPNSLGGLIYCLPTTKHTEYQEFLDDERSMVFLHGRPAFENISGIFMDREKEMETLVAHLVEKGAKRIGMIVPINLGLLVIDERLKALPSILESHGLTFHPEDVRVGTEVVADAFGAIRDLFEKSPDIDALIMTAMPSAHRAVYEVLRSIGKRIPEDVMVVTLDRGPEDDELSPPLSSLSYGLSNFKAAYKSVEFAIKLQEKRDAVFCEWVTPEFKKRGSTRS